MNQKSIDVIGTIRKEVKKKSKAGRPHGTPNKGSLEVKEILENMNVNPIEVLAHFMTNNYEALGYLETRTVVTKSGATIEEPTISPELRAMCAKELASYVYAKRRAIEVTGKDGEPLLPPSRRLTPEELSDIVRRARVSELKASDV